MIIASVISEIDPLSRQNESLPGQVLSLAVRPFKTGRQFLFDGYQHALPRQPASQPVVIVAIDEQSLKQIGQWPWPRNRLAELIDAIGKYRPAAVGLDFYMPEVDQTSPARVAANLPPEQSALAQGLRRLPSHETLLAQSLRRVPGVLGVAGFDFASYSTSAGMRSVPLAVRGGDALLYLRNYPYVLASLPELQAAARGQAMLTISSYDEGIVRRVPLVVAVNEQPVSGLAMEMLRVASGSTAIEVDVGGHGIDAVQVAELRVPTQGDGQVWLHFARAGTGRARNLSAADVLAGTVDPERVAGKLILIGLTGSGLSDLRMTALGELVPGIEVQAQLIESLFDGRFVLRPWWMKWLESSILALIGLLMIGFVPGTAGRFAQALKESPRATSWAVMGLNVLIVSLGYLVFHTTGLLFDSASTFIGISSVLGSLVSSTLIENDRQTRLIEADRQRLRENEARVAGEMAVARRIQLGSLPDATRVFAGERRFALTALLEPARDVGGDLYDFFMIDERRLCFMVGDVSGKGVPASLFMAIAKTLAKSIALRVDSDLGAIVTLANRELARENAEMLFVTLLVGVLDAESGELSLVNAGHDGPWRISAAGEIEHMDCPAQAGGPPLCVIDDHVYVAQQAMLRPGDTLCLITDGVGEAMNANGEAYGTKRLEKVLKGSAEDLSAHETMQRIRDDIAAFVGAAEASDDLTLLVLRWNGADEFSAR